LDAVLDSYIRDGDTGIDYITFFGYWATGVPRYNGSILTSRWTNSYIDDMQWIALATSRANKALQDKQQPVIAGFTTSYTQIWNGTNQTANRTDGTNGVRGAWSNKQGQMVGITDPAGAGMFWNAGTVNGNNSRLSKNACANSPGSILAAYLHQWFDNVSDDNLLQWAEVVYDWVKRTLFDANTGAVWDNVHYRDNQNEGTFNRTVYSYNTGTFLGAAVELFNITGNAAYIADAIKAADHTLRDRVNDQGYMRPSNGGDGDLFHGIFCRYLTNLILCDALDETNRQRYIDFLLLNGWYLWHEGLNSGNKTPLLIVADWGKPNTVTTTTLNEHVCGATLLECLAKLQKAGKL
jgi:predicted alpha-1,6-mannanase (GH76 family)